ncbi:tetratricopeptide repeat protein [Novispirillum itersonii]|uniref:Flp pilus assembly protein TadD n=1 Tax=Novispirillum itersonii TaxID=189 RepID=A0A7W9ZI53_NOVIT|nr:hypothetical protein [Novispirillum itersonii]MBB6211483.1 Flp pilus assembly protein TadD [Novispirillum itersonii]
MRLSRTVTVLTLAGVVVWGGLLAPALAAQDKKAPAKASAPAAAPAPAVKSDVGWNSADYAACMKTARERPKAGFDQAGEWAAFGGGVPAEHCRATALIGLNEPEAAADLLETLAEKSRESAQIKVGLLRQAAQARTLAGQPPRALAVLNAAAKVLPGDPDVLEDRAVMRIDYGEPWDAVDDLNGVLDRQPNRVSALVLRAAAYRRLETLDLAKADIQRALALEPNNPDALVESGILARVTGNDSAARTLWMSVLRSAPESPAADIARANLAKMDVKVK